MTEEKVVFPIEHFTYNKDINLLYVSLQDLKDAMKYEMGNYNRQFYIQGKTRRLICRRIKSPADIVHLQNLHTILSPYDPSYAAKNMVSWVYKCTRCHVILYRTFGKWSP